MNYFIEGLQGSGKSTLADKIAEKHPEYTSIKEGDYSPVELAWCARVTREEYEDILERYSDFRNQIEEKSFREEDCIIICYTKVRTENRDFYRDLEQHEIYNGRIPYDEFKSIILNRLEKWDKDHMIFECSLFQNIVEDMILFRDASDEEILDLYREIGKILEKKEFHIIYLKTEDIPSSISVIRRERSDKDGNELWFPLMMNYFNRSPYARNHGLSGEAALYQHLYHRQQLELRICREIFPDRYTVLPSKNYRKITF